MTFRTGPLAFDALLHERNILVTTWPSHLPKTQATRLVRLALASHSAWQDWRIFKRGFLHIDFTKQHPLTGAKASVAGQQQSLRGHLVFPVGDFYIRGLIRIALWQCRLPRRGYTRKMRAAWQIAHLYAALVHELRHLADGQAGKRSSCWRRHHDHRPHEARAHQAEIHALRVALASPRMQSEFNSLAAAYSRHLAKQDRKARYNKES